MKKNKQELIEEAAKIAKAHQAKKAIIEQIFLDLDREEKASSKHISCIATVNEILKELEVLEQEHEKIIEEIRK